MNLNTALRLQLGDSAVEVSADRAELKSAIIHTYRSFVVGDEDARMLSLDGASDGDGWRASVDGREFVFDEFDFALGMLVDVIDRRLLGAVAGCLLLHAAVVSDDEKSILVVGPSGAGKTTVALELTRRGMRYIADEFTAIEPGGTVIRPFPRSAIRKFDGPTPQGTNLQIPQEDGFRAHMLPDNRSDLAAHSVQSWRIIFPRHQNDAVPAAQLLTAAQCCARLMPSIFGFEGREKELLPTLADVVVGSRVCELNYREVATDLDLALNILD